MGCAGEAVYTDDIPSPPHCLYAASVMSTEPYAKIKGIDTTDALKSIGAVDFVSAKDVPKGGRNVGIFNPYNGEEEQLFAEDDYVYVGQPLGVVVNFTPIFVQALCIAMKPSFEEEFVHVKPEL